MPKLIILKGDILGTVCAVPENQLTNTLVVDEHEYLASGWASVNAGLNPNAIGSHLFPKQPGEKVKTEDSIKYTRKLTKHGRADQ